VQLTIRGLVQTPVGNGTMIPEAWCFFMFSFLCPRLVTHATRTFGALKIEVHLQLWTLVENFFEKFS